MNPQVEEMEMGREIKRVPISFDWFEKTKDENNHGNTWKGYLLDGIECPLCNGSGVNLKKEECSLCYGDEIVYPEFHPPSGNGWQMWETCSEGGPISPVFESPEELAHWLTDNNASTFTDMTATYKRWFKMIAQKSSLKK